MTNRQNRPHTINDAADDDDVFTPPDDLELPPVEYAPQPVRDEASAHAEHERTLRALRVSIAARAIATKRPIIDLDAEEKRLDAAKARAFAGKEHYNFFPRLACTVCGGVPWLDDERQRVRENHNEKHGFGERVRVYSDGRPNSRGGFSRFHENADDAYDRARRSTGER
jgi:hypothetical protein